MSSVLYTLRKKISTYTSVLASILFVGLGFYAISPMLHLPDFFYMLFPVWIWGRIAITDGDTYQVIGSICLLMTFTILLFVWGYAYPKRKHYAKRLKIWIILFNSLLACSLMRAAIVHITAIPGLREAPNLPDGMFPMPYTAVDDMLSRMANIPPIYSIASIVFIVVSCFYITISVKVFFLLRNVNKLDELEQDLVGIYNSEA